MLQNPLSDGLFPFNEAVTEGAQWLTDRSIEDQGEIQLGFEANNIHDAKWPKLLELYVLDLPF